MVIQNNWIAGAENKRHRFREALLWKEDRRRVLHRDKRSAAEAPPLQCNTANRLWFTSRDLCSQSRHADRSPHKPRPAPPSTCSFTNSSGLVPPPPLTYRGRDGSPDENVLDDTVDADWCTTEWFFDMGSMKEYLEGTYREGAFLEHPKAKAAFRLNSSSASPPPSFFIEASPEWRLLPPQPHATILHPSNVSAGATDEEIRKWFTPHAEVPIIDLGDMAGRVQMPNDSAAEEAALSERITNGIVYREEISRYVRQQVTAASPFECLCIPSPPAANGEYCCRRLPACVLCGAIHRSCAAKHYRLSVELPRRSRHVGTRRIRGGMAACVCARAVRLERLGTSGVGSSRRSSIGWSASMRSGCIGRMGGTRTREFSF